MPAQFSTVGPRVLLCYPVRGGRYTVGTYISIYFTSAYIELYTVFPRLACSEYLAIYTDSILALPTVFYLSLFF